DGGGGNENDEGDGNLRNGLAHDEPPDRIRSVASAWLQDLPHRRVSTSTTYPVFPTGASAASHRPSKPGTGSRKSAMINGGTYSSENCSPGGAAGPKAACSSAGVGAATVYSVPELRPACT